MKKVLIAIIAFAMVLTSVSAQELEEQSVNNTLWTGLGLPHGEKGDKNRDKFRWAGIIDTVQARVDVGKFTMEGMLSWGALPSWDGDPFGSFSFENTELTQFDFLSENRGRESYYLDFVWHPFEGFDAGMGTQLDWGVGPSPYTDGLEWEATAHVEQGDLLEGVPNWGDVVGYMHYANTYAWKALAARYTYKDIFQVGIAIPDPREYGNKFTLNIGAEVNLFNVVTIAAAYENLVNKGGNFYTGVGVSIGENLGIDAWFGLNGIGLEDGDPAKMLGTGVAVYIKFGSLPFWIRPEFGLSKYLKTDNTLAFYTGGRIQWDILEKLHLGAWGSVAWGARNKNWPDEYDGGFIWNVRPDITFDINLRHSISATFEYESIRTPDDTKYNKFLFGFFWKYNRAF